MGIRRKARESALQILFQLEFDDSPIDRIFHQFWEGKKSETEERRHCEDLVTGILLHKSSIDAVVQSVSTNWRVERMVLVDRNILRMAAYEMFWGEQLAPGIVINEALEIAKKFSGERSATFINGILDAIFQKSEAIEATLKKDRDHE
jgi:N utilization substance protein B